MKFRVLAPGKINLCLFLGPPRHDGRHELVTLFESVSLADELSVSTKSRPPDRVHCDDFDDPNLATVALERLRARGWDGPPLRVKIAKRIPVAGGMGGGSADAAAVLRLADELQPLPEGDLARLAAELGADVPSQLAPGVALGTGAGECVTAQPPLAPHTVLVMQLPYRLSTREVYAEADRQHLHHVRAELDEQLGQLQRALSPGEALPAALLVNELQPAALSLLPEIGEALDAAVEAGADHALVSGSGPTVVAMFWGKDGAERAGESEAKLRERFPRVTTAIPVQTEFAKPRRIS